MNSFNFPFLVLIILSSLKISELIFMWLSSLLCRQIPSQLFSSLFVISKKTLTFSFIRVYTGKRKKTFFEVRNLVSSWIVEMGNWNSSSCQAERTNFKMNFSHSRSLLMHADDNMIEKWMGGVHLMLKIDASLLSIQKISQWDEFSVVMITESLYVILNIRCTWR